MSDVGFSCKSGKYKARMNVFLVLSFSRTKTYRTFNPAQIIGYDPEVTARLTVTKRIISTHSQSVYLELAYHPIQRRLRSETREKTRFDKRL